MTIIRGLGPVNGPSPTKRTGTARGGFVVPDGPEEARTSEAAGVAEVGWAGMLALQEAEGDAVQDRSAKRRGQDILDELAGLQRDLLRGGLDPQRLGRLADMTKSVPQASDPGLRGVVAAVALRARIEMARRAERGK